MGFLIPPGPQSKGPRGWTAPQCLYFQPYFLLICLETFKCHTRFLMWICQICTQCFHLGGHKRTGSRCSTKALTWLLDGIYRLWAMWVCVGWFSCLCWTKYVPYVDSFSTVRVRHKWHGGHWSAGPKVPQVINSDRHEPFQSVSWKKSTLRTSYTSKQLRTPTAHCTLHTALRLWFICSSAVWF